MYLIIQKSQEKCFCYFESDEQHHASSEQTRKEKGLKRLDNNYLVNNPDLDHHLKHHGDFYFVFEV